MAGLKKYVEWMSRGRKTDRVAYVLDEWDLPEPQAGAEWAADNAFNAAEEVLRDPSLGDVFKSAIDDGSVVVRRKPIDPSFLLPLVPVGENSAISAKAIWQVERLWSPASIKARLNELAKQGLIERKQVRTGQNVTTFYYRMHKGE
jgi:hypothetical protein